MTINQTNTNKTSTRQKAVLKTASGLKIKICVGALICASIYFPCLAQEYTYTHYNIKDGLAGSTVYCAEQDRDGFIWFGTETGLSRFDGTRFVNYGIEQGLPDNEVLKIFCDSKNRIWLSLFKTAICYILKGKVYTQYNDSVLKKIHLKGIVWQVCESIDGDILIREEKTLHIIKRGVVIDYNSLNNKTNDWFISASKCLDGGFLICDRDRIYQLSETGKFFFVKKLTTNPQLMGMTTVSGDIVVWQQTQSEFRASSISKKSEKVFTIPSTVIDVQILNDSFICINRMDGSLIQNLYTQDKMNTILPTEPISSIYHDYENNLWFTTLGHGIFRLNSLEFRTLPLKRKNGNRLSVFSLVKNKDVVIAGTDGCYVFSVEDKNPETFLQHKLRYVDEVKNRIVSLQVLNDTLYLGTDDILIKAISYKSGDIIDYFNVKQLLLLNNDSLLVGTKNSLVLCNAHTFKIIDTILNERVICLNKVYNQLYIGTLNGLVITDVHNHSHTKLDAPILRTRITALEKDMHGTLWIGTYGGGVVAYQDGKVTGAITQKNGLTSNICRCITAYKNSIWIGTDKGINKISLLPEPHVVNKFTSTDGLPSDMINVILQDSEFVFVGTSAGLTYFNSDKIAINSKCNLQLTNIKSGSDTLNLPNIKLPHKKNTISFEYVAISYNSAGDIKYYYRINGLKDTTWQVTSNTSVNYPSLPSGQYSFEIRAINKYGVASKSITVPFEIEKQIWEKWWFKTSFVLAAGLIIWFAMGQRIKQVRKNEIEKNNTRRQIVDLQQKALKSQISPHFIFNCLNSVQQYVVDNDIEGSNRFISDFSTLIRKTLDFSEKNEITLKEELGYLETYLKLEQERFENKFKFEIFVQPDIDPVSYHLPPLILQPVVENAVRHGVRARQDAEGLIEIEVTKTDTYLIISIKDNGPGIEHARKLDANRFSNHISMGFRLVQERIKVLNDIYTKKILLNTSETKNNERYHGTEFKIKIPL